jgi:hypothetical protein
MRLTRSVLGIGVALVALHTGCSGGSTEPTPGTLNVGFSSPNDDDGAVLFTISGGPVESVEGLGPAAYSAKHGSNTIQVIIVGDLNAGTIARIRIPDRGQVSQYSVSVDQVASRGSHLERDPTAYRMSLTE